MVTAQIHNSRCAFLVIHFWLSLVLAEKGTSDGASDCALIKCYFGTMVEQDQHCVCQCSRDFFGVLCEQEKMQSIWPAGPYALLKPATGCPEKEAYGWSLGYINITTQHSMDIWIKTNESVPSVPLSETTTKLAGPFGNYTLQLNFCFKHENWPSQSENIWPTESVSVFGAQNGCPKGMIEEERVISLPPIRSWWGDGYLPHFEFRFNDNVTEFLTKRCRLDGAGSIRAINYTRPFIFTKETGINCTEIKATEVGVETIKLKYDIGHKYTNMTLCIYTPRAFKPHQPRLIYAEDGFIPDPNFFMELETSQAIYMTIKCRKQLGVTDGTIDDYQITASSWDDTNAPYMARVSDTGWCPAVDDHNPFLQIDLFTISLIAGMTLFNRVNYIHSLEGNVYSRRLIPEGCRSFMVSHGIHPGDFTNYIERPFIADSSQVFEEPHTFMFLRPVLARYIRIHPIEPIHGGRLCLRIELLGCPSKAKLTPLCEKVSKPFWVPLSTANPSSLLSTIASASGNMSSLNDCKQACEELRGDCRAIQYITNMTCDLYTSPFLDTALATRDQQHSSHSLVCLKEQSMAEFINLEKDTEAQLQVLDNNALTNIGYPLYYRSNTLFKWTVTSADGGFIRITFVVIDFYTQSTTQNTGCSGDTLVFNEAFEPITSSHNGLTPTIPTEEQTLEIVFHTCERIFQRSNRRKGFKIFLESEASPTIWQNWTNSRPQNGNLMSYSLLGFMDRVSRLQRWSISSGSTGPYIMTFWHFNVPCDDNCYLIIHDEVTIHETKLCNTQFRPKKEYRTWYLQIDFSYTPNQDLREEIGFGAYFERSELNNFPHWLTRADVAGILLDEMTTEDKNVYYVCSRHVNKCYIYSRLSEFTDWLSHAKQCNELGYHQPVIHNRKEMEYLPAWLLYMEEDHLDHVSRYPPNIYTHIGLVRYQDGWRLQQVWQDGTLLTFSGAWDSGEPSDVLINDCTGMNINMTTGRGSWVTFPCSSIPPSRISRTFASVCEKPFLPKNSTGISNNDDGTFLEPEYKELLFHCNSTEWVIYTTVCDGIKDCSDGSDELNCHLRIRSDGACLDDEFSCANGACIHVGLVCNFIDDCPDGSDEYCVYPDCTSEEYSCFNGQCVPLSLRCDAIDDCYDGSDEYLCAICNPKHAFSCGDFTCIPRRSVCNGIQDCEDNRDERCGNPYDSRTCFEYWNKGYDKNVTLTGNHYFIECQFYIEDHILKITSILDLTNHLWNARTNHVESSYFPATNFIEHGETCAFEISEQCKFHVHKAASFIDPYYNGSYSFCQPSSVKISTDGFMFSINKTRETIRGMEIEVSDFSAVLHRTISRHIDFQTSVLKNISTKVGVAICTAEYFETDINCGNGMTVSADRMCLYFTRAGVIDGCRNFKHLENCENFLCPSGYTKCPSSFCVAQQFICDGKRQCPGGEDEENCWCVGGDNYTLVFVYHGEFHGDIKSDIFKFARQFYSKSVNLYAISYIDISNTLRVTLNVIHPYNEALNLAYEETFLTKSASIESELVKRFKDGDGLRIISIEQEDVSKRLLTGIFFNVSNIGYVYRVRVDKTIQQKANVANTKKTHMVAKSFGILANIGSQLFPSLCKEAFSSRGKAEFKCMSSKIYVPLNQTCDGIGQCPYGDDEAICDFKCLQSCSCEPYIVNCQSSGIGEHDLLDLDSTTRVLNISITTVFEDGILSIQKQFPYLLKLYAKHSSLKSVKDRTFTNASNLIHLDLSFNKISVLRKDTFFGLSLIKVLKLEGNIFLSVIEPTTFRMFRNIDKLSITHTRVSEILPYTYSGLKLNVLDISDNTINTIHAYAFSNLTAIEIIFERNEVKDFDANLFVGVQNLYTIRSSAYKFCCYKPSTVMSDNCWPHEDEFSSCEDLMRNPILQTLLWVVGAAALVANGVTFLYRLIHGRKKVKKGFGMFVMNLAVSDFLMGLYLIIIAAADLNFRKRYMLNDSYWRNSVWCNIAGILATVSSEASVLLMCLITLDRFMVIKFPFGQWRFNVRASRIAVSSTWMISLVISLMPVIVQDYFQGSFYSTSGVCLAMPLTHRRPPGWLYSFLIFVALNFVAFIMIAIGQLIIYLEIRKSSKRMEQFKSQRSNDISVARNLLLVLTTDFLCWFPIGVMAIMAYGGYIIPGDVYAWTAVLVLPINSALNPFLYTLSAVIGLKKAQRKTTSKYVSTTETSTRRIP